MMMRVNSMKYFYKNDNIKLIIEEDGIGFYLIVYKNPSSLQSTEDYLLDTLQEAFQQAQEKFGIPQAKWKKII